MARKGGDITLSTYRFILAAMVANGQEKESAEALLFGLNDEEDGEAFDTLVKWSKEQERNASGYIPGKPGRKSSIDEQAIARTVLARFVLNGVPTTPEILAAMPDSNPVKAVLGKQVTEGIKAAKALLKAQRASEELSALAASFAKHETDSMPKVPSKTFTL
jgi:hypothetical protein